MSRIKWWDSARETRLGSIFLANDFGLGLLFGLALSLLPAFSKAVQQAAAQTILLTLAAAGFAIVALALAAFTLVSSLLTPEYLEVLKHVPGGVKGLSEPYMDTAVIGALAALTSVALALAWPAVPDTLGWWQLGRALLFVAPATMTGWATLASIKLIGLGRFHLEYRVSLLDMIERMRGQTRRR